MSLTFNTKTYSGDSFALNSIGYTGSGKTASVKDDLLLSRSAPKPTDSSSGVARAEAKLTRTLTLTGAKTLAGDARVRVMVDVPVGYASGDVDALLNDMGALVSGADMKSLVKSQKINF